MLNKIPPAKDGGGKVEVAKRKKVTAVTERRERKIENHCYRREKEAQNQSECNGNDKCLSIPIHPYGGCVTRQSVKRFNIALNKTFCHHTQKMAFKLGREERQMISLSICLLSRGVKVLHNKSGARQK